MGQADRLVSKDREYAKELGARTLDAMRALFTLLVGCFALAAMAQAPKVLTGLEYRGTAEARHQEGCEGCGNVGFVRFESEGRADYLLPGSDIIEVALFKRERDRLELERGGGDMELKGDTLFFTIYDFTHTYVRVR